MPEHHAAPGPYNSAGEARLAVSHLSASPPLALSDGLLRLLEDACRAAGVELGAYDHAALVRLAGHEYPEVLAVVAGLITRAHEPPPLEELMGPAGVAQEGGGMVSGSSNWPPS
jgi:hypothetical protein